MGSEMCIRDRAWGAWIATLLTLRHAHIMPGLPGARSLGAKVLGPAAVRADWRLGNGMVLTLMLNLAKAPLVITPNDTTISNRAMVLFDPNHGVDAMLTGHLPACSLLAFLEPAT